MFPSRVYINTYASLGGNIFTIRPVHELQNFEMLLGITSSASVLYFVITYHRIADVGVYQRKIHLQRL